MFYSHTFLGRKGPLGTVWCAAHLQHKLKKSHYITTNVSSTAQKIMNPDVPIALRMSGHLLLGVVRIYSKQVEYFFDDCNEIRVTINKAFMTVSNINLPSDTAQAPFHSITLPEKYNLDTIKVDDYNMNWSEDSHLKRQDEITLTEQIPTGNDPYIVISVEEHHLSTSSLMEDKSGSGPKPMEEDDQPHVELDASVAGFKSPSPTNNLRADGNKSPQDFPSIEHLRDAQHGFDFHISPILPDRADPDKFLEDQIKRDKDMHTSDREEVLPDAHFSSSLNYQQQHSIGNMDSHMHFDHHSPELQIHPTPEMEIQPTPPVVQPTVGRKRKQPLDTEVVLSNAYIKDVLDDTSDILRVRVNCPLTSLAIWKQNTRRRLRKEDVFVEPVITGSSADLQGIYREDIAKHHLVTTQKHVKRQMAVAQYLKKQSATPILGNSDESSEDLSLKKILNDKPRKICARIFYETLVLKNYRLVDVDQKETYDDIILKVTPKLSKEQFSG
ncbi:hypothetical protein C2S51_035939 [Perilla frutescens var. frutescens]|nr:hypothetical protein C2S51_035939 [Perilla frutescens var. frutescens]